MWPFLHPKPRPSLYLAVQLGAGLLVPMWVAPALAQGVAVITPSPAMAPRDEREKLAPAVMAPAAAEAMRAEGTANQLAWRESLKRMSEAEADDPSRALAAYKRFFSERTMSPELGVEVGLKIAQLRLKLGDSQGALQTCEVLAAKYADAPTAVLLALQKARVLMESKQLAQASECVNEAMPELVALGPSRYREISDVLLKLVQANLDSGDAEGKERAKALCVGVEQIYLRWTKKDAVDHLWQRFEALQVEYQQAGDKKRAEELLPKVGDALLKTPIDSGYIEGSVLALEAARWSSGQGQKERANLLYQRIDGFNDGWHTMMARYDQASPLINAGELEEAKAILAPPINAKVHQWDGELAQTAWLASIEYQQGDLAKALELGKKLNDLVPIGQAPGGARGNLYEMGHDVYLRAGGWETQPIQTDTKEVIFQSNSSQPNQPLYARFRIKTYGDKSITASVVNSNIQARVLPVNNWQRDGLNAQEEEMEVIVQSNSLNKFTDVLLVLSSATHGKTTTVRLSLVEKSA